jgi:tRNA pseudouridine38-40 synthase
MISPTVAPQLVEETEVVSNKLRYRLLLEYDGTDFFGWQFQPGFRTVQGDIEKALWHLYAVPIRIYGAGRTDTGVHALSQVAHFEASNKYSPSVLIKALNYFLPEDVRIRQIELATPDFHARFSARWRYYRYRIYLTPKAVERHYGWRPRHAFDLEILHHLASKLKGEQDFASFSGIDPETEHYRSYIHLCLWEQLTEELRFHIVANRFLRNMVRRLVGTMTDVARGRFTEEYFQSLLNDPIPGCNLYTAPPRGLCLMQVGYDIFPKIDLNQADELNFCLSNK